MHDGAFKIVFLLSLYTLYGTSVYAEVKEYPLEKVQKIQVVLQVHCHNEKSRMNVVVHSTLFLGSILNIGVR